MLRVHEREEEGDVLVFLPGQDDIERCCTILRDSQAGSNSNSSSSRRRGAGVPQQLLVLPLYGALPQERQQAIFTPSRPGVRKVVVATNIAETSLTIDGVRYVVDPGFCKQKVYNPATGMDVLLVSPIAKVGAAQRAGRAGRTSAGKCYRLYSKEQFEEMRHEAVPEIQRTNLSTTLLYLKVLGVQVRGGRWGGASNDRLHVETTRLFTMSLSPPTNRVHAPSVPLRLQDVASFDFMDPPPSKGILTALRTLELLGALDSDGEVRDQARVPG